MSNKPLARPFLGFLRLLKSKAFWRGFFFQRLADPPSIVNLRQERARKRLEAIGSPNATVLATSGFKQDQENLQADQQAISEHFAFLAKMEQEIIGDMLREHKKQFRKLRLLSSKEMNKEDLLELQVLLEYFQSCYDGENVQDHIDRVRQLISEKTHDDLPT